MQLIERFLNKVRVSDSGCWEWTGFVKPNGYGNIAIHNKPRYTHRTIYEYYYGNIDSNLTIDHLCRNRRCCNPNHLEQVTTKENLMRGNGLASQNAKKTHCPQGHEYNHQNTYTHPNTGFRSCLTCKKIRGHKS